MGSDQSTTFAYCGRGPNPDEEEIEKNEQMQTLTSETNRSNQSPKGKQKMQQLRKELDDARAEIKDMLQQYEAIKAENSTKYTTLDEQYQSECQQKTKAMNQIQNSKTRYEEVIAMIKEEHAHEIEKYKTQQLPNSNHNEDNESLKKQIDAMRHDMETLQKEYDEYKHTASYDTIDIAEQIIDSRQQEQINIAQNNQQERIKALEKELEDAFLVCTRADSRCKTLNQQYQSECERNSQLMTQIQEARERHVESNQTDPKEQILKLQETEKDNATLRDSNKELEDEVSKLTRVIEEYKAAQEQNDNTNAKSIEMIQMEQENSSLKSELDELKTQLMENTRVQEGYKTEIEEHKASNVRLEEEQKENVTLMESKKELEDEVEKLRRVIEEYKTNPDEDGKHEKSIEMIELEQENASLKNELMHSQQQSMQNQETITMLNQQMFVLQNQLNAHVAAEKPSNKSVKAVMSHETNVNEERMRDTIEKSREIEDVDTFVRDRYGTVDKGRNHDINESDDSSLSEQEKLEIEIAKRSDMNDEEVKRMQKEIADMAAKKLTATDGDDGDRHLFRYASKMNWDNDAVTAQKNAMKEQMIKLLQNTAEMASDQKGLKAVMSHETNFSEDIVRDTIDKSREVGDADTFVRDRYGTVDKGRNYAVDESDESSLSEQEKLEIEIAKRNDTNDEEVKQMQKEIDDIQKTMAAKKLSVIDDDCNEYDAFGGQTSTPGNLFRYASKMNWDTDAVTTQKNAMKEQMIKLLQQQESDTSNCDLETELQNINKDDAVNGDDDAT